MGEHLHVTLAGDHLLHIAADGGGEALLAGVGALADFGGDPHHQHHDGPQHHHDGKQPHGQGQHHGNGAHQGGDGDGQLGDAVAIVPQAGGAAAPVADGRILAVVLQAADVVHGADLGDQQGVRSNIQGAGHVLIGQGGNAHHAIGGGGLQALEHLLDGFQVHGVVLGVDADKVEAEVAHKLRHHGMGRAMKVPSASCREQIRSRKAGLFRPGAVSFWAVTGPPEGAAKAEEP